MKVVIAPDSFKGTLSAPEAARAMAVGWAEVRPDDDLDCGLHLVAPHERSALDLSTFGVGELLSRAAAAGARRFVIGLGGSATTDGGLGFLSALGVALLDGSGVPMVRPTARHMNDVGSLELAVTVDAWQGDELVVLHDVMTPFALAAEVFGPQKGASPNEVGALTTGLRHWGRFLAPTPVGPDPERAVGSGAAGGLGGALLAVGATLVPGAAFVADEVGLDARLDRADLLVLGEGQLDRTSSQGKVVGEALRRASSRRVPVAAVVGRVKSEVGGLELVVAAAPSGPGPDPFSDVGNAGAVLAQRVTSAMVASAN